jgi:uncharacterized protein (DUF885 family)
MPTKDPSVSPTAGSTVERIKRFRTVRFWLSWSHRHDPVWENLPSIQTVLQLRLGRPSMSILVTVFTGRFGRYRQSADCPKRACQRTRQQCLRVSGFALAILSVSVTVVRPTFADSPARPVSDLVVRYTEDKKGLSLKHKEPLSEFRSTRMLEFFRAVDLDLNAVDPKSLSGADAIDRILLKNEIEFQIAKAKEARLRDQRLRLALSCLVPVVQLLEQHERTHAVDAKTTAELLVEASKSIRQTIADLESLQRLSASHSGGDQLSVAPPSMDATLALYAVDAVSDLLRSLDAFNRFYSGYNPLYSWWCALPYDAIVKDCRSLVTLLKRVGGTSDDPDQIIGHTIGDKMMAIELRHEMIPYTPVELIEIAERELKWCDEQMLTASREMGFGDDWAAAMEAVKQKHVAPGDQPAMIHRLATETIAFLKAGDMVTVPPLCEEVWRMEMMTPERQRVNPFFLGGDTIIVSYPTDTMTHEEKLMSMRGNNEHFARATVHHELIPGHHLQQFSTKRYRPYRRVFETPFWIEGWALYWEMLLWDKGFARSPEDRIGMLFWRKHRCARIIFSLGFQLGRMSPEQCVEYLITRVGHEPANATAEVRRSVMGGYPPLYQAAYMLGGLQIRALRTELVDSGKMTERDFHDAILREGPIPIAMVRAALTSNTDEDPMAWRFADSKSQ